MKGGDSTRESSSILYSVFGEQCILKVKESLTVRKTAYFHQRGRWIWISFLVLASALIVTAAIPSSAAAYTQQKKNLSFGQVNINTGTSLGTIPSTALGI